MNIVHVQCSLHLLKARTMMDIIFLSHSYILVFPPKSLFSITLILICITLSLVTLLGNPFSSHFIALCCKRNVIYFICCNITRIVPRDCLQGGLSTGGTIYRGTIHRGTIHRGDYTQRGYVWSATLQDFTKISPKSCRDLTRSWQKHV